MTRHSSHRFTLVGLLLAIGIVLATMVIIDAQRNSAIEAYRTATNNLSIGMARQTARLLGIVDAALLGLGDLLSTGRSGTLAQISATMVEPATMTALVADCSRLVGISALALIDRQGSVVASCGKSPVSALLPADRQFFEGIAADQDSAALVGPPVRDAAAGEWMAPMARRVQSTDGQFAGIVLAVLSLHDLEDFYKVAMPPKRSVTLAGKDGIVLAQYPPAGNTVGTLVPNLSQWNASVSGGGGAYLTQDEPGAEAAIVSVNPLPGLPFVVEASVLERLALADWATQRTFLIAGGGGAIAIVLVLLWLFAWQYRKIHLQYERIQASEAGLTAKNFELDRARGRLHAALSNISQGVCFFDGSQKLQVANDRYASIYGLSPAFVRPGVTLAEIGQARIAAGTASAGTQDSYISAMNSRGGIAEARDFVVELRNGRTVSIHHQPMEGGGWVATHEDISERREAEAKIAFLATHDVLTGLANRALLQERIERAQAGAKQGSPFAILFLDLDGFKAVNSSVGHQGGDELLHSVAKRLIACVREGDTVARTGGDEFVVLMHNPATASDAATLANRIIQVLSDPFSINGIEIGVGTSIGIAVAPLDGTSVEALTRGADVALYRAKAQGRGRFQFYGGQTVDGEKKSA